jgi:uncharacterized membrane protein
MPSFCVYSFDVFALGAVRAGVVVAGEVLLFLVVENVLLPDSAAADSASDVGDFGVVIAVLPHVVVDVAAYCD